ncbi:unnamed protein product [Orchesella dallaii]|uniref:TGF-beta family profile domain-containing protein n=1 Tax=Orchesella dallaii TaxID=48710 RepID=A0ABP1PXW6_9HEXA
MKVRVTKFLLILSTLVNLGDAVYSHVSAKDTIWKHRHGRSENKIEKSKPHKYLTMLLSSIGSNPDLNPLIRNDRTGSPNTRDRGQEKNLFFTWMPTEVKETSLNTTTIMFQSFAGPKAFLGDFTGSTIVLTIREDFQYRNETQITMHLCLTNNNLTLIQNDFSKIQSQFIIAEKKFYTFDIYNYIAACLQNDSSQHTMNVNITFEVTSLQAKSQTIDFKNVFDLHEDNPFIMICYHGFLPKETVSTGLKQSSRKTRSVNARPSSQCQRREFIVDIRDIVWPDIIFPQKLDLGICSGTCPTPLFDQYYNMTFHSFLLDSYRMHVMFDVPRNLPHSQCIPITYKPITVLELDEQGVLRGKVERDASVDTCGCRY